ncbi:MAG TPA: hypothetical protein VFG47_17400 [Geminicoccaceae bacterium]|nr:hypothetical protein [Geminicoccaceae bacterium]
MANEGKPGEARRIGADVAGAVPVEYALIAVTIVFAILGALRVIGHETSFGFPPILNAFARALS